MGTPPGGTFPSLTRNPEVSFARAGVAPPSPLYIRKEDFLFVRVWNSDASVTAVTVKGRILDSDGRLVPFSYSVVPTSDRALTQDRFPMPEGFLMSLTVTHTGGNPQRGQLFVQVGLDIGVRSFDEPVMVLVSDYLTAANVLGWPRGYLRSSAEGQGFLRSITGTDPAAGVEISETVPTNARWRLLGFRAPLVTSATVATRRVHLLIDDGTTTLLDLASGTSQAASLTRNYNSNLTGLPSIVDSEIFIQFPHDSILLAQGFRLRTSTTLFQAGDNWGAPQMWVEEWIEE